MLGADVSLARTARGDFIEGEHRVRLERAVLAMRIAHEPARPVGSSQMLRAVDVLIDRAGRTVLPADVLLAARASRHLVGSDRLALASFAEADARRAETPFTTRRTR